jgi:hypothetical protein
MMQDAPGKQVRKLTQNPSSSIIGKRLSLLSISSSSTSS